MQFTASHNNTSINISKDQISMCRSLGYTISTMLPYTLTDEDIEVLLSGGSLSISEVTVLTNEHSAKTSLSPVAIVDNAAAAQQFPMLANDALKLALAAISSESSAVSYAATADGATEQATEMLAATPQTMAVSQSTNTEALGYTIVLSEDPVLVRRVVPMGEMFNAAIQH